MKRLLFLLISLSASSLFAMQKSVREALELKLGQGIGFDDLAKVKEAVDAGAPLDQFKYGFGYVGVSPLSLALNDKRWDIAEYLLSRGVEKSPLNQFLNDYVASGDVLRVKWLLDHGATDLNNKALRIAKDFETDETNESLKDKYSQIIKLLEQAKRGPVKLTPMAKPVAAAKPVAKPAAQPVRLVPLVKPAAVQPK